jgi:hypothetical protein
MVFLQEKGATELTKGVLGAEDIEKAEGRPAPFKKKGEAEKDVAAMVADNAAASSGSKQAAAAKVGKGAKIEPVAEAAEGTAAPTKKKKKKKKKVARATAEEPPADEAGVIA